jgi:molybdenum cofactor cytidylyltransferase
VIAAIILAGGESKRMGFAKLMLEYQHTTLLTHAIQKAKGITNTIFVVVGKYAEVYRQEAQTSGVNVLENPEWPEGLASSLRVGVASLPHDITAALILLPDQPFVPLEHLQALVDTQAKTGAQLVFSSYQGILGAPTLIHASLFEQVQTLSGNTGARALIKEGVSVAQVVLEASIDIDTPEDARKLEN